MTSLGNRQVLAPAPGRSDWVSDLTTPGEEQNAALRELHTLMVRAARSQVSRMLPSLGQEGARVADELANQAADEAMMALLGKLSQFEGRSRFTTWAYKFAVLQAATVVRSFAWRDRPVPLDLLDAVVDPGADPGQYAEAADLVIALRRAMETGLSPHQRRVVVALLVEDVPIDVLAERLGSTRNALYKCLHDARQRLRSELRRSGHLPPEGATS